MAKRTIPSASPQDFLQSKEWQSIQRIVEQRGIYRGEQPVGQLLWWIMRTRERAIPEEYRLPNEIAQVLSQFLQGKGFKPPAPRHYDHDEVARFIHHLRRDRKATSLYGNGSILWACVKAQDRFGCTVSSAETWYYQWRKKQPK